MIPFKYFQNDKIIKLEKTLAIVKTRGQQVDGWA